MKRIIKFLFTLLILFAFSCTSETTLDPLPTDLEGVSAKASSKQTADVQYFEDEELVEGSSATLHRTNNGVTLNVKTSDLVPGDAYTVWFVVWNSGYIDGPPSAVLFATGHVIGGNGKGNFSARLSEDGTGLTNAEGAEIHIVIRSHGQPIPGMVDDQIHTFGGGCETNDCADHQFAIFEGEGAPEPE